MSASECLRRRISMMKRGTAIESLGPQSQAPAMQIRSGPKRSTMSAARCGRDLGLRVEREAGPVAVVEDHLERVLFGVIDEHARRLERRETRSTSTEMRVPLSLSSRCGVWIRMSCLCASASSICSV